MSTVSSSREFLVMVKKQIKGISRPCPVPYYLLASPSFFLHSQCALCSENFLPRQVV